MSKVFVGLKASYQSLAIHEVIFHPRALSLLIEVKSWITW